MPNILHQGSERSRGRRLWSTTDWEWIDADEQAQWIGDENAGWWGAMVVGYIRRSFGSVVTQKQIMSDGTVGGVDVRKQSHKVR